MVIAFEIHVCPFPRQSVLESSQMICFGGWQGPWFESNLQKQGSIPNPAAIEILHLSSYGDDLAFGDEKSSPRLRRRFIHRWLIPLCTATKSTSVLTPGDVGKIPWLLCLGYVSICQAFSGFLGEVSQRSVNTMDCLHVGSGVRVFLMLHTLPPLPATVIVSNPEARPRSSCSPPALDLLPDRKSLFHSIGS